MAKARIPFYIWHLFLWNDFLCVYAYECVCVKLSIIFQNLIPTNANIISISLETCTLHTHQIKSSSLSIGFDSEWWYLLMQPISKWIDKSITDGQYSFVFYLFIQNFLFVVHHSSAPILLALYCCCSICLCCVALATRYIIAAMHFAKTCVKLLAKPQFTQFRTKAYIIPIRLNI